MADAALLAFVAEVGDRDPVTVRGGATQWNVGGPPDAAAREVVAPAGIVEYVPEEMTVTVLAGTTVEALHGELADHGQRTTLSERVTGTVGGAVVVGRDTVHRRGRGLVRDALLQARYVSAEGRLVTAGGPTVKNVTGFDLCRLLVGSLGTLGLVGEVILRTQPIPPVGRWCQSAAVDPFDVAARTATASAVLWDGTTTWVHLEGHEIDVDADQRSAELSEVDGPPTRPVHLWAMAPSALRRIDRASTGPFVAEIGVGAVHAANPAPPTTAAPELVRLNQEVKARFDPPGRLNPGRDPLRR